MKKLSSWLILFTLLFSLCSCSQEHINDINSGADRQEIEVTLNAAEHTELNFRYTNGERAIRDFAVDNAKIIFCNMTAVFSFMIETENS